MAAELDPDKETNFHQCMDVRNSRQLDTEAKTAWLKISIAVLCCIVLFALILYCFHRRNARRLKSEGRPQKKSKTNGINRVMVPQAVPQHHQPEGVVEQAKSDRLLSDCD